MPIKLCKFLICLKVLAPLAILVAAVKGTAYSATNSAIPPGKVSASPNTSLVSISLLNFSWNSVLKR